MLSSGGTLMVVVARTPDGRAFTLFAEAGAAQIRNRQLFQAMVSSFQVSESLGSR